MKKFNKAGLLDLLFVFFLSLTPLLWFRGGSIMDGDDLVFPLNPLVFFQGRTFAWIDQLFGQSQSLIMGTIPIHFIDSLPSRLGFSIQNTEKIVYVFWFFVMGLSAYYLARTIRNTRVFTYSSVVFLLFNFFILQGWWVGERTKFSAYAALFLVLAIFIKVYRGEIKALKGAILNSLILFFFNGGGLYGIALYGGFFLVFTAFVLFFGVVSVGKKHLSRLKNLLLLSGASLIGFILVNAYYLLPALSNLSSQYANGVSQEGGVSGFLSWAAEISAFASYANIFRLQGIPEWYDNPSHPYSFYYLHNPFLIMASFLFPLFVFLAVFLYRKKDKSGLILFLFFVYLISIVFTAGTHPPLGFIYTFLLEHVPGFVIFRSAYYKFAPALFLSSALLTAFFFDYFKGKKRILFSILFILFLLAYHFPFFTGNFFSWQPGYSTRLTIPHYIFDFGNWLNTEKRDDGRILVLPPNDPALQYETYRWGYLSFQSVPTLFSNKSVVINNNLLNSSEQSLLLSLYSAIGKDDVPLASKIASALGIQYLLIEKDKTLSAASSLTSDIGVYEKYAKANGSLVKQFGEWEVYKLQRKSLPLFFTTNSSNILDGRPEDIANYFTSSGNSLVTLSSDLPPLDTLTLSKAPEFYVPQCISCLLEKNKPVIQFPTPSVLPDSPFYPFILWRESRSARSLQGKSAVYNDLGMSLKRISEIKTLGVRDGDIPQVVLSNFNSLTKKIFSDLQTISARDDQIQTADDVRYYLEAEKSYLFDSLDTFINEGSPVAAKFAKVNIIIDQLLNSITPFLYKLDPASNQLYKVILSKGGNFQILLNKQDVPSTVKSESQIQLLVDGNDARREASTSEKFVFDASLASGTHYISLSFPSTSSSTSVFTPGVVNANYGSGSCYVANVSQNDNQDLYRISARYANDFSSELLFYIWEQNGKKENPINVVKLRPGLTEQEYHQFVQVENGMSLWVGICADGLTQATVNQKISVASEQILSSSLLFVPLEQQEAVVKSIKVKKNSPTKYTLSVSADSPLILTFLESYDNGWKLSQFQNSHFRIEGYGNAWIIDGNGNYNLTLSYSPQNKFLLGVVVSGISLGAFCFYLYIDRRKRDDEN